MITEQTRQDALQSSENQEKDLCRQIIEAAAVYERLEASPDWQIVQTHMKGLSRVHTEQIAGWLGQMSQSSFFKRMRLMDTIMVHQIRLEQLNEAISYPKRIIADAVMARDRLSEIKTKENHHG